MPFTKRLCAGFQKIKNKNLSQTKQLSQKGNQDLWLDKSMVWRSLHHKEILVSEPGRNRRECILTRNSPFILIEIVVLYYGLHFLFTLKTMLTF